MISLLLNVLFASAFTLIIKWVQVRQREDICTVGPINYIVAAVLIGPQFFSQAAVPDPAAAICGAGMGVIYFVAFFFVAYAIKEVGAAATTVVGSLSLLLPIIVAAYLWEEVPNIAQTCGVAFAVAALILIGTGRKPSHRWRLDPPGGRVKGDEQLETSQSEEVTAEEQANPKAWLMPVVLTIFFLFAGSSRLLQRTLNHVSSKEQLPTFLFAAFVAASLPSIVMIVWRRKPISGRELGFGVAMGASNILQSHFILKALTAFAGYIVFPVSSSGGLLLTTFVATGLLGERITRRTSLGIAIATVALVLLNWVGD